ncbi:MAG: hypothetical protein IJX57_07280, partial [Clostridia bacterium]|nr:hypothetical protein [Clostridia bacterium]
VVMENEILYQSVKTGNAVFIDYYIIPENISADYCDLKYYGIRIEKTAIYPGGGKIVESNQINNVFYRYDDIKEFLNVIAKQRTEPVELLGSVEKYIAESIDRARETA